MSKGFVLLEINTEGQARVNDGDTVQWVDFRLEDVLFYDAEGVDQLHGQLPDDLKDCKVLVVFDYVCNCSRDYEGDYDCEELFNLVNYTVMQDNYKEFTRELITIEMETFNDFNTEALEDFHDVVVADWEEFYDEDFVPIKKEPKKRLNWGDRWF